MLKYRKQKFDYDCAVASIYNACIWAGIKIEYDHLFSLCAPSQNGTPLWVIDAILGSLLQDRNVAISFLEQPSLNDVKSAWSQHEACLFCYSYPENETLEPHIVFMKRNKNEIWAFNENTQTLYKRIPLEKIESFFSNELFDSKRPTENKPYVWFLRKNNE